MQPAVTIESLSKCYRIGRRREASDTFVGAIGQVLTAPIRNFRRLRSHVAVDGRDESDDVLWALHDVSFDIRPGEVVGMIGRNGAGKSTLLKILSRITEPTAGRVLVRGRVATLLEVGTGFHPELTGRDNVYLNGAILGMRRNEIRHRFDEIVAFAEVERFIDTPVKRYSSGMQVRLGFAVAAHLDADILVVDEVLAVGDAEFQRKCLGRLKSMSHAGGRSVVFVSHNMGAVTSLCGRAVWFDGGRVAAIGAPNEVVTSYLASTVAQSSEWTRPPALPVPDDVRIDAVGIEQGEGSAEVLRFDLPVRISIQYTIRKARRDLAVMARVTDADGNIILTSWDTDTTELRGLVRTPGAYVSSCQVPARLLRPGRYFVSVAALIPNGAILDDCPHVIAFEVSTAGYSLNVGRLGVITPLLTWDVHRRSPADGPAEMRREPDCRH